MGLPSGTIEALQLSFEGLLNLYKSDNERFWETLKGITSRQESTLANVVVENMTNALRGVENGIRELNTITAGKAAAGR